MKRRKEYGQWLARGPWLVLILVGGCQTGGPTSKEQAQQSWNDQRAALKCELASAELQTGRVDKAVNLAREAVGLSPDQPGHAVLLARAYLARGDFAAARRVLQRIQKLHPEFGPASYLLGTICEREQHWKGAIESYGRAIEAEPDQIDYLIALAQAVAQTGDYAAARAVLDDRSENFEAEPAYHLAYAEICQRAADLPAACQAYERVLRLGIDDLGVRTSLGLCLYWMGRPAASLEYLNKVVREKGEIAPAVMCAYTGALIKTGATGPAAEWLRRFTDQRPDVAQLWLLTAEVHSLLGELEVATSAVRRAVRLEGDSPDVLLIAATVYLRAGDVEAAEKAVQRVLRQVPNNVDALIIHGRTCEHRGDKAAAAEAYQAAWDLEQCELASELLARLSRVD
ncbi:MAG: tetratricopeptide repeat protein [Planctomycetota bacterium]